VPSRHILVVDNEILMHTILAAYLKNLDRISIDYSYDADSAYEAVRKRSPDLLIINNDLKYSSGVILLERLRKIFLLPPQIILFGSEFNQQILDVKLDNSEVTCLFGSLKLELLIEKVISSLQYISNLSN